MSGYLAGAAIAFGVLVVVDSLVRPGQAPPRTPWAARLIEGLEAGASRASWAGGAAVLAASIALAATGWVSLALVAGICGAMAPRAIARGRQERRRLARREALAQVAARLRDAIRGARDLPEAIVLAAETAPAPLRQEMVALREAVRLRGAAEGLEELARASDDPLIRRFARTLAGSYRSGSRRLTALLEAVAEAAWLQARTAREVRARQTSQRIGAGVMAAAPLAALLALRATNPAFLEAYEDAGGQMVMLLGFALVAAGWWAARSLGGIRR